MTALHVENVYKTYGKGERAVAAVRGVSFRVEDGEVFGLLGMNGAGKSTTIKMCTGLIDPNGGSISVYGHDIRTEREQAKSMLNISPQETAVAGMMSVRENLIFASRIYGANKTDSAVAADGIMQKLRLSERANTRANKLSGGLMRRLSIGMALITKPKLVFLDEPTLGLDVVARRELWKYIKEIRRDAAVILTTHYLEEAEALCDRIAVMSDGKLAGIGTVEELKAESGESTFENAFLRLANAEEYIDE